MIDETSIKINRRFFEALDILIAKGSVKSYYSFCTDRGIDRRNFTRLQEEPGRKFQLSLLWFLVVDYKVSADWLITGKGKPFR